MCTGHNTFAPTAFGWLGTLQENSLHVYTCDLAWTETQADFAWDWLHADERSRAERWREPVVRRRFIAGRAYLRWLLGQYLHLRLDEVEIRYAPQGKPVVDGIQFNLAHSWDVGVIAFAQKTPMGVDVEWIDPQLDFGQAARLAFSPQERAALEELPEHQQRDAFYQIWTCKEALLKAIGGGFHISPRSFSVQIGRSHSPRIASIEDSSIDVSQFQLAPIWVQDQYSAAIACIHNGAKPILEFAKLSASCTGSI